MKAIITENKLFDSIYNYIDKTFNPSEMSWVYGVDEDEDGYPDIDRENENFLIFYQGDWQGDYDSDMVFYYFEKEYYDTYSGYYEDAPILEVLGEHAKHFDNMFGNYWEEPMKKWFQDNFNLPVNTISTYYNYEDYN